MGSADEVNIQATELNRTMKVMHFIMFQNARSRTLA